MEEQHLLIDDVRDFGPMRTCRHYDDGIKALQEQTWDVLWLDWDMGAWNPSGMDVLDWLERTHSICLRGLIWLASIHLIEKKWQKGLTESTLVE